MFHVFSLGYPLNLEFANLTEMEEVIQGGTVWMEAALKLDQKILISKVVM
mgnify:CR=1 FL=1